MPKKNQTKRERYNEIIHLRCTRFFSNEETKKLDEEKKKLALELGIDDDLSIQCHKSKTKYEQLTLF